MDEPEARKEVPAFRIAPPLRLAMVGLLMPLLCAGFVMGILDRNGHQLMLTAAMGCIVWFVYRNPKIGNAPAFSVDLGLSEARDLEYLWLGLALFGAAVTIFEAP